MTPITTETELTPDVATETTAGRVRRFSSTPEWLLRVSIESVLIVASILLALAVDEWRENAGNRALARQSLQIFDRELRQNMARLDGVIPYHNGLREVAAGLIAEPERLVEIRSIVEGLEPVVLLNTAWETALATGALTHIDVETVSALSLTYSLQQRFREETRSGLPQLITTAGMTDEQKRTQIQQTVAYLSQMTRAEQELRDIYVQALEIISRATLPTVPAPGIAERDTTNGN